MTAKPILYSGTKNASSWAMRAWLALREAGYAFDERVVDIRRPQRFTNLADVGRFSPPACVPVFVTESAVIFDSLAIMEFANDFSGGRLLPVDMALRARARSLVAWQHSGLSDICARISFESAFYHRKRSLNAVEIAECGRLFAVWEHALHDSGGPYLFGQVSLADFSHTPAAIRLSRHAPDLAAWPLTRNWFETILAHEAVQEWLRDADALPPIWYDDYLDPTAPAALQLQQTA
ncbi:MAG: glutathione S-transferase family protein [Parasphingopyxis sp.]|uniref:glutathione S-transferase family protein n=1 Tax=Parasphingopyxis sp. TaxID=1920299 RepID=UPI003F9F0356